MIQVFWTYFDAKLPEDLWKRLLDQVPERIQTRIVRYTRWQDRQAGMLGKLLLSKTLKQYAGDALGLDHLRYSEYGRPFFNDNLDFNISHAGEYVVCALTDSGNVGIDIEKIRPIDFSNFERCMTVKEWEAIRNAPDPYAQFFELWVKKESVLKADGRGLSVPFIKVTLSDHTARVGYNIWGLKELVIDARYKCWLAANVDNTDISVNEVELQKL